VHLLLSLPTTIAVAKAIQLIKRGSSAWIHDTFRQLPNFAWQEGYGAFSVSVSHLSETVEYIKNQAEHHRTRTFQEEYLGFLKKHNPQLEDKYLWN
jgi:putative transposase